MAPKPSCSLFRPFRGILGVLRAGTDSGAKGILKAPRVLLVVVFPIVSIILYCRYLFPLCFLGLLADYKQ